MKQIGLIVAAISALCLLLALNMSTTVTTQARTFGELKVPSVTVHNIGLMQDKQNYITVSAVFLIIGLAIYFFSPKKELREYNSNNVLLQKKEISEDFAIKNAKKFSLDEKSLSNDEYQIYLVEKYKISKNDVLNKYILHKKLYENLDAVLLAAMEEDRIKNNEQTIASQIESSPKVSNAEEACNLLLSLGYQVTSKKPLSDSTHTAVESYEIVKDGTTHIKYSDEALINFANFVA